MDGNRISRRHLEVSLGRSKHAFALFKQWVSRHKTLSLIGGVLITILVVFGIVFCLTRSDKREVSNTGVVQYYQNQLSSLSNKVAKKPDDATAHRDYAVALYVTGDIKSAKEQYETAVKLKGDDATLHNNLANTYRDLKEYPKAIHEYEAAISVDAKYQNAYINMANLQINMLNKPNDAIATYKRAVEVMPDNTQLKILLGLTYEQAGNIPQSIQTFKAVQAQDPDNKAAKSNLARLGVHS